MSGAFITFEGIDGCGKSTQLQAAATFLRAKGLRCEITREPGGTPIAEKIRELLLSPEHSEMNDRCEVLLYLASRAQHVSEKILPLREQGAIVLCDRFAEATFAYQGFGRGMDLNALIEINKFATGGIEPDLVIVLDVDLETAAGRLQTTGKAPDRMEGSSQEFYRSVRQGYQELARRYPDRIVLVDATGDIEAVTTAVKGRVDSFLLDHRMNA